MKNRKPLRAVENINRHKDDRLVVLETSGVPFFDEAGRLLGYRGVDRDITERREMERERERLIEEDRRRLVLIEVIFEATQDGIAIYDPEGRILRMNAAAEEFLGYTAVEQAMDIDQRWEFLRVERMDGTPLPPEEIPSKLALKGERVQTILHFQPPRRPSRWFSLSAAPIRPVGTGAVSAVLMMTDITDFHNLQEEQKLFMQMISHDLRTPITVIQGHAEMINSRLSERDEVTDQNLEAILAATMRLDGMMEDLLQMIHLERGQVPLEYQSLDVAKFAEKLVCRSAALEAGHTVKLSISQNLPPVQADPGSLERVLCNLITNAVKYSPPDAAVEVTAEVAGEEMRISVIDHGKGISPEDLPHLFDRFFRAKNAGPKKGLGLGLYIARRLVEAHGGRVWVESEPGKGAVFTLSLPLRDS